MVETTITQIFADNTIGMTVLYIAVATFLALFSVAFFVLLLSNYKHRSNSETWYRDQVYAFKAGYIKKTAEEKGIEMIYPPKADLATRLEEEVCGDMNTP